MVFTGVGTATSPQLLEVTSRDLGAAPEGFTRNNAYANLTLQSGSNVKLVDDAHTVGQEALYANTLVVPAGMTLDLNGLHVYARDANRTGTFRNGSVGVLPGGGPLTVGTLTPGNLASASQTDEWAFYGRANRAVTVVVNTGSGGTVSPLTPVLGFAEVSVLDAAGNVLAAARNTGSGADAVLAGVGLPADGTYRIRVRPSPNHPTGFGHYLLTAYDATVVQARADLNQTLTGQIDTPYRVDRWTFAAAANTQMRFNRVNAASSAVRFTLTGPNGYVAFSESAGSSSLLTLPSSGTYDLTVHTNNATTGGYAFRLDQTTQVDLTPGTPYGGTLAASGQAQLFRLNAPDGNSLLVDLCDGNSADRNELYVKFGAPPTREDFDYGATGAGADQRILVPSAAPGDWYVLVYGDSVPAPSAYTLLAQTGSVLLTGVTPDHYARSADATLTLTGAGFDRTTTVSLVAADNTAYDATSVSVDLPTQLTATFRTGTVPSGVYSVRVARAGSTSVLPNAFRVVAGGEAVLKTNVVLPAAVGYHQVSTIYVEYTNTGDVAMPAPLLTLTPTQSGRAGAFLTLDSSRVAKGFWTSAVPDGFSHSVQILGSGATPGVLQPGETVRVPVYYAGWQQPWDFTYPPIRFNLDVLRSDAPQFVTRVFVLPDHTETHLDPTPESYGIDWESLKDTLRPPSISPEAWNPIFANLVPRRGTPGAITRQCWTATPRTWAVWARTSRTWVNCGASR